MNRPIQLFLCFAITLSVLNIGFAQESEGPRLYWVQHYMKVKPENRSDYEKLESEVWKPVHIERKKSGQIIDWFLFKVISPSGADNEYDYVTGQLYTDFGLVNSSACATDWMKAHPGGNPMAERTGELRDLVRSEILVDVGSIASQFHRGNVSNVFYWKVPQGLTEEYLNLRQNYFRPAVQSSIAQGNIESWFFGQKLFPEGPGYDYHFQTHDVFHSLGDVAKGHGSRLTSIPDLSEEQRSHIISRMMATKELHKRELWHLLDTTQDRTDEIEGIYAIGRNKEREFSKPENFSNGYYKVICDGVRRVIGIEDGKIVRIHGGPARFNGSTIREQTNHTSVEEWIAELPGSNTYSIQPKDGQLHQRGIEGSGGNEDLDETWTQLEPAESNIEGVWQTRTIDGDVSTKIIIDNFWNWIIVDPETNRITEALGGSYTFDGETYTERTEFHLSNEDSPEIELGIEWKVTAKVRGNQLIHRGRYDDLPETLKRFYDSDFVEVWTRAK